MPGRVVSVDDSTEYVFGSISDPVPLLVSGNRNQVYVYSQALTATGSGPAITLTGTGNRLYLYGQTIATGATTAIQGSAGRDEGMWQRDEVSERQPLLHERVSLAYDADEAVRE